MPREWLLLLFVVVIVVVEVVLLVVLLVVEVIVVDVVVIVEVVVVLEGVVVLGGVIDIVFFILFVGILIAGVTEVGIVMPEARTELHVKVPPSSERYLWTARRRV